MRNCANAYEFYGLTMKTQIVSRQMTMCPMTTVENEVTGDVTEEFTPGPRPLSSPCK